MLGPASPARGGSADLELQRASVVPDWGSPLPFLGFGMPMEPTTCQWQKGTRDSA